MPDWTVRAPGAATDQNDQGADQAPPETSISQTPAAPNEDPMVALAREAADYKDKLLRSLADSGRTVIVVTHSTESLNLCDRVLFLAP